MESVVKGKKVIVQRYSIYGHQFQIIRMHHDLFFYDITQSLYHIS